MGLLMAMAIEASGRERLSEHHLNDGEERQESHNDKFGLIILYVLVFFAQFKPSDPFKVDYLVDVLGMPRFEVFNTLFPIRTYFRLPSVALIALLSEVPYFGGAGVITLGMSAGFVTEVLTRYGKTLFLQKVAMATSDLSFSTKCAVPAMIFQLVARSEFQRHSHLIQAFILASLAFSALCGEFLRDAVKMPLGQMIVVSAVGQGIAVVAAVALWVHMHLSSRHAKPATLSTQSMARRESSLRTFMGGPLGLMKELLLCMSNRAVVWWALWIIFTTPAKSQVMLNWQSLIKAQAPGGTLEDYNGIFLAAQYLVAATLCALVRHSALLKGYSAALVICSMLIGGVLQWLMATETQQFLIYTWVVLYVAMIDCLVAVSDFQVGKKVTLEADPASQHRQHFIMVFCVINVIGGVLESGVQLQMDGWSLEDRFQSLGLSLLCTGAFFLVVRGIEAIAGRSRTTNDT